MNLVLTYQVAYRRVGNHELIGRYQPTGNPRQKTLRKHTQQRRSKLGTDLRLLCGREAVNNAIYGLGSAVSVQRREYKMAGFRGGNCGRNRLRVAHLSDHCYIDVLTTHRAKRPMK